MNTTKVERFWINNLTPGPEACENFEDASSILGSVLPVQDKCQRLVVDCGPLTSSCHHHKSVSDAHIFCTDVDCSFYLIRIE